MPSDLLLTKISQLSPQTPTKHFFQIAADVASHVSHHRKSNQRARVTASRGQHHPHPIGGILVPRPMRAVRMACPRACQSV